MSSKMLTSVHLIVLPRFGSIQFGNKRLLYSGWQWRRIARQLICICDGSRTLSRGFTRTESDRHSLRLSSALDEMSVANVRA